MSVSVPSGMHAEIKQLAERVDCTEAAAVRMLLLLGLEAMQESKNPFKRKR